MNIKRVPNSERDELGRFKKGCVPYNKGRGMNPKEKKEARKKTLKKYNNKPERKEFMRLYGIKYRKLGKKKQIYKKYYNSNNGKLTVKKSAYARLKREYNLKHSIDWDYWKWLCRFLDYRCQMCGRQFPSKELTVDHIVPIIKGGDNNWENLQPLCKSCNSSKQGDLLVDLKSPAMYKAQKEWQKDKTPRCLYD